MRWWLAPVAMVLAASAASSAAACAPAPCSRTAYAAVDAICGEAVAQARTPAERTAALAGCACIVHAQGEACDAR